MMDSAKVKELLKTHYDVLPSKAQGYARNLEKGVRTVENETKLILGILYDVLKSFQSEPCHCESTYSVILLCFKHLIKQRNVVKRISSVQLDSFLYEMVKTLKINQHTLHFVCDVAKCVLELHQMPEGCSKQTAEWFSMKLLQPYSDDITCNCHDDDSCTLLERFELSLLGIRILTMSGSWEQMEAIRKMCSVVQRHFQKFSVCTCHGEKVVDVCGQFLDEYAKEIKNYDNFVAFSEVLKSVFALDVSCLDDDCSQLKNTAEEIRVISAKLKLLLKRKKKRGGTDSFQHVEKAYKNVISYFLSIICTGAEKLKGCLRSVLDCVNLFFTKGSQNGDTITLAKIFRAYFHIADEKDAKILMKEYNQLLETWNTHEEKQEESDDTHFLTLFRCISNLCIKELNSQHTSSAAENASLTHTALLHLFKRDESWKLKNEDMILNIAILNVKANRMNGNFLTAMEVIEQVISSNPTPAVVPLVTHWLKSKQSAMVEVKDNLESYSSLRARTLATNLRDQVPNDFLEEVLLAELRLYESISKTQTEQVSVIDAILSINSCSSKLRSIMLSKLIRFQYGSHNSDDDFSDVKTACQEALGECKPLCETWESFIQIKLVEFLCDWHKQVKEQGDKFSEVCMGNLHDIIHCCKSAVEDSWEISMLKETCETCYDTVSILRLFGHILESLNLLFELVDLLEIKTKFEDDDTEQLILWNKCKALCMISDLFFQLRQTPVCKKYADLAHESYNIYMESLKDQVGASSKQKNLFIETLVMKAQACLLSGEQNEASDIIKQCEKDEFLQAEKLRSSSAAGLASVRVMGVRTNMSPGSELHTMLARLRRITTWTDIINPEVSKLCDNTKEVKGVAPAFGLKSEVHPFSINTQVCLVHDLLENIHSLSESYLLLGDVKISDAYIAIGLIISKCLLLRSWYISFCLLKTQLISLLARDDAVMRTGQSICELFDLSEKAFHSSHLSDFTSSVFTVDDELGTKINERLKVPPEKIGCNEDDAIEVSSQPIDLDACTSKPKAIMASPLNIRRVKQKSHNVPGLLTHSSKCQCETCNNLILVAMQLDYVLMIAEHCARTDATEEGMKLCRQCVKSIQILRTKFSCAENYFKDSFTNLFFTQYVACLISISNLYYMQCNKEKALKYAKEAQKELGSNCVTMQRIFHLNAKVCLLLSQTIEGDIKVESSIDSEKYLNAVIDSLSACHISQESMQVSTPVCKRSTRASRSSRNVLTTKNGNRSVTKSSRSKKTTDSENKFQIFKENSPKSGRKAKLPIPEYIPSESDGKNDVYDFASTDDENIAKSGRPTTQKKTQNIMLARKVATRRHRKLFGAVYTDEEQEKVRALPKEPAVRKKRVRAKAKNEETPDILEKQSQRNPCSDQQLKNKISYLTQALSHANAAGDFRHTKICAQALSSCHHQLYAQNLAAEDKLKATAFHLLSIGITLRSTIQVYAQSNLQSQSSHRSQNAASKDFMNWLKETIDDTNSQGIVKDCTENSGRYIQGIKDNLKKDWTVCAISLTQDNEDPCLLLSRLQADSEPVHLQVDGKPLEEIIDQFNDIMCRNQKVIKSRDKSYWWTQRKNLERELLEMISTFSTKGLGYCRGVLLGRPVDEKLCRQMQEDAQSIIDSLDISSCKSADVEMFLNSWYSLSPNEKVEAVIHLCGKSITSDIVVSTSMMLERLAKKYRLEEMQRHHVILVLDKDVQLLPWESDDFFLHQSMTRMPSFDILKMQMKLLHSAENNVAKEGVNLNSVSYIVNPQGDLHNTENMYKDWFGSIRSWKGIMSREPTRNEWASSISEFDLFIYCGHGSGSKYMSHQYFRKIRTRAAALLMGCNSGKLDQDGIFDPLGIVLHYLISGSPCVLGCLWPVTDKDIDKYLNLLLNKWASDSENELSLPQCARKAKAACKMPNLNGSCCVVYGLPVHCQVTIAKFFEKFPAI